MVPRRRRAMHVARIALILFVAVAYAAPSALAQPQSPLGHEFELAKTATPAAVGVGDVVLITITFKNDWAKAAEVRVRDMNPNPAWFEIDRDSITGGAVYLLPTGLTPEGVQWSGTLARKEERVVTFEMKVIGGAGMRATNFASLVLVNPVEPSVFDESAEADISIKPAAPVLDPIDNADGNDSYLVEWSEVAGAVAYILEEDDNNSFDSPIQAYGGPNSQVLLQGRSPGIWYYRVFAVGAGTVSSPSNIVSATVVLGIPQLFDIVNPDSESSYLVEWSQVSGATSYTLEEDDNQAFASPTTRYLGSNQEYQVNNQPDGVWYYRVRANGPGGVQSDWSLPKSTRVGGPEAYLAILPVMIRIWPPTPETPFLQPIQNPGGVGNYTVNWSTAARAKTYILEKAGSASFQGASEVYVGTETSFQSSDNGASRLYYRVKARNPSGESAWSNVQMVDVLWELEPNDSAEQANGPLMSGLTYFGTFPQGAQDLSDYYFFELPAGRTVEIRLTNIAEGQNYDLVLRDISLNARGYSANLGNNSELIKIQVPGGKYLVQVYHRDGAGTSQPYHVRATYE